MTAARAGASSRRRAWSIYGALLERYPGARCELAYDASRPHELLVATILSAQATDASVNRVTPGLFRAFPTAADFARAGPSAIEPYIRSIGLFRTKARAVHASMAALVERFGGEVPRSMDELVTLRGVARKTANVVLGNAFGINAGVVVDTHVERLSKRFGFAPADATAAEVERRLMGLFPRETWCMLSHLLIFHGRRVCKARGGTCASDAICRRWCMNARRGRSPVEVASVPGRRSVRSGRTA